MTVDFTHLHLHTQYSFLDGAIKIKELINKALELKMKQVAITDHGNMFGALDFYLQAKKAGIKPILGTEAYITGSAAYTDKVRENYHIILLAENNIGYENLKKLTSESFINGKYFFPRIDKKLLYKHKEGIIATTACLGSEVSQKLYRDDFAGAKKAALEYKEILGRDNFFLEIQPNGIKNQEEVNQKLLALAKEENLRTIVTNDCHYVEKHQHDAQNILMAIRQQKPLGHPNLHQHELPEFYIKSEDQMLEASKTHYMEGFANACEVGNRCHVQMDLGKIYLPDFPFPGDYHDEKDYLIHLSQEGLKRRFKEFPYKVDQQEYKGRLAEELEIINSMGFAGYFLIVQDFINWAKNHEVKVGPGRGSGAGSLVAYALRITDIDPIPYNLLFERFLNPERVSMPDFDIDFMQEKRGDVINYVAQRYGREKVGQIATYSGLNPKSAIKDVARTLGISFAEINELTKPMPQLVEGKKPDLKLSLTFAPALVEKAKNDETYKKVLETAAVLEGLYRQAGVHAGGVVIGKHDLSEHVPVFTGQNGGDLITQFDKDKVEVAGLVKFDFLGLKTLDVIAHAENLINERILSENKLMLKERENLKEHHPHCPKDSEIIPSLCVEMLPLDKQEVFELISSGDTLGVFQVESAGFQDMCRKLKPDCFEDIVAAVALYRPGPMQSGMVDDFIDRKHGRKKVTYPHPLLETVLMPTYGTIVYQEQVMQSAQVLAGYTLGGADLLRRAMGKKKFEEMEKQREMFVDGAQKKGVRKENASEVFDTIEKFAGYGFNKSHSAAYAMITYQTAYLKRFYPVEFMAALLTTSSNSTDDVVKYINEARKRKIEVLPPDVNISGKNFTVDYGLEEKNYAWGKIRFGLGAVKGLGDAALETLVSIRQKDGLYEGFFQFCQRVSSQRVNKKVLEALIKSGSFDGFTANRKQMMESIDKAMSLAQRNKKEQSSGQTNLFALMPEKQEDCGEENMAQCEDYSFREKLYLEKQCLGFFLSGHPLAPYKEEVKKFGAIKIANIGQDSLGTEEIFVMGVVSEIKERVLKRGKGKWASVLFEDDTGQMEVLCFSKYYQDSEELLKGKDPLILKAKIIRDDFDSDNPKLKLRLLQTSLLSKEQIDRTSCVNISLPKSVTKENLDRLKAIFDESPGEKNVKLEFHLEDKSVFLDISNEQKIHPSDDVLEKIGKISSGVKVERR